MKTLMALLLFTFAVSSIGFAGEPEIGKTAPAFELKDVDGNNVKLADFMGKTVVLEWVNYDCPFVKKHYGAGNMQDLQKTYREKGVIWLSICSSAPGKQGHFETAELKARMEKEGAAMTAYLIDESGDVGRLYGAKTTPHMYIINSEGTLVYMGGIDDKPSTKKSDIEEANNFVRLALDSLLAGKEVEVSTSKPYGCSVKY